MKTTLLLVTLLAFGCGHLGYASSAPTMVEVDPDAPPAVTPSLPRPSERPRATEHPHATAASRGWRGLVTGGGALVLVGGGLAIGGVFGLKAQEQQNRADEERCRQQETLGLCDIVTAGTSSGSNAAWTALTITGVVTGVSGIVLIGIGLHGHEVARRLR